MVLSFFAVLLAGISVYSVDCLTCLHCTDIQSPRHCKYVTECQHGEVCNVHQTTNPNGDVEFDVGCVNPSACSNRSQVHQACDECCNAAGCGMTGYPSPRGPVCYNCPAQITDGTCHRIDFCENNEVCMINEQSEFGDTVYSSQCVGLTRCERHTMNISQIIGRSISDDTRSLVKTVCHKCCHDDLCNAYCDVDYCASDPCMFGNCVNGKTGYTCVCQQHYIGRNCSDVDYCASGPCMFGNCVNGRTGYTCVCQQQYTGRNCSDFSGHGKDCLELRNLTLVSGLYRVRPAGMIQDIEVYCDMTTDGGGWTVFQRRVNGSVDFYQNFSSYENGFGDVHGEHWLGLKYIYAMTNNALSKLRIDLTAANGSTAYEVFSIFRLSMATSYTLLVDQGTGTAGDAEGLSYSSGFNFYAYDHDNGNGCALASHGGWWYGNCVHANLNGKYVTPGTLAADSAESGIIYRSFSGDQSLKETKMMFRRV